MKTQITIEFTQKPDGLGVVGDSAWYVCDWGVPVGNGQLTREAAVDLAKVYIHEIACLNRQSPVTYAVSR